MDISTPELLNLSHSIAKSYLEQFQYPWEALKGLKHFIETLGPTLDPNEYQETAPQVWIAKSANISKTAYIGSPCIIGPNTEVRHCAYIRASALIGAGCVIGNSTELKNVILFDEVQVPHYNYVGDSILGYKAHMGAGSITSNFRSDHGKIRIQQTAPPITIETDLNKLGAIIGDHVEIGCNTVLNPGSIIGAHSIIYPLSAVRGYIPPNHIFKSHGQTQLVKKENK